MARNTKRPRTRTARVTQTLGALLPPLSDESYELPTSGQVRRAKREALRTAKPRRAR